MLYYDHILTTPFPSNQNVYYTVCAQNMIGMGACSNDFAVLTDSVPLSMVSPTLFGVWYNQISLNWTDEILVNETGRSPITYYEVRYKANVGDSYTALTTSSIGKVLYYDHFLSTPFPSNQNVNYTICA